MKLKVLYFALFAISLTTHAQNFRRPDIKDIALAPQQNEYRNILDLSGVWNFKVDSADIGEIKKWYNGLEEFRQIAVPGCWNDQFTDLHTYLDAAWYETKTYIPSSWKGQDIYVRIGSAIYATKLWINGKPIGEHLGGFVPFAFNITDDIKWNANNRITIRVENHQRPSRVPLGGSKMGALGNRTMPCVNYDFFPYSGINRKVELFTIPQTHISDITVRTDNVVTLGKIHIRVDASKNVKHGRITISDQNTDIHKNIKFEHGIANTDIQVTNVKLWSPEHPHLYMVSVTLDDANIEVDHYELQTGIRTISSNKNGIYLNGKKIYLRGFGRHEDFPVLGRTTSIPINVKDFELMKWEGANSFRTSHYPYDDSQYDLADREGIMVIDEIPAVGLYFFDDVADISARESMCKQYLAETITRDKNHPSIIMWSVANEPMPKNMGGRLLDVQNPKPTPESQAAMNCLSALIKQAKDADPTRLVSFVGVMGGPMEWLTLGDVVMINRYYGWYTNIGSLSQGMKWLDGEIKDIYKHIKKPIIVSELGADAVSGLHSMTQSLFSEDYQTLLIRKSIETLEKEDFVSGVMVWNLSDFHTSESILRVGGMNLKGMFTYDRQPKMAAWELKELWSKKR